MDNPLLAKTALDMSPEEEWEQLTELEAKNKSSLLDLNKERVSIEKRRTELDIEIKKENLETAEMLNHRIYGLIATVADPDVFERLMREENITLRDVNEGVKAVKGLSDLRKEMVQATFDASANSGSRKRVNFRFSGQGDFMMGFELDD